MDAREVAMLTLNACQRQGGWSDGVLKKQLDLLPRQPEIFTGKGRNILSIQ